MQGDLAVTGNADADKLLNSNPLALLLGMLLDQHMQKRRPAELAISRRVGGPGLVRALP